MGILTVQTDDGPIEVIPVNKQETLDLEHIKSESDEHTELEPVGLEHTESESDESNIQQEKQGHRGSSKKAAKK